MSILAIEAVGVKHSGAASVLLGVIDAAITTPAVGRIVVFASDSAERRFEFPENDKLRIIPVPTAESRSGRIMWALRGVRQRLKAERSDAVIFLSGVGVSTTARSVTLIQQSLPFISEVTSSWPLAERLRIATLRRLMKVSASRADIVVVQTEVMRLLVARRLGLDARSIRVVRPTRPLATPTDQEGVTAILETPKDRRLLYVGNFQRYKNISTLFCAFEMVRTSLPDCKLFLASPFHKAAVPDGVVHLGNLSKAQLRAAYSSSTLLVMPSLAETISLPLVECLAMGTPIVAADRPYAREVCQRAAWYFDATNPNDLAEAVLHLLTNRDALNDLRAQTAGALSHSTRVDGYDELVRLAITK